MTQEEYLASVQKSQEEAHDETMWGKPARDIITGIGNNGGIRPVRAIWELVQNARDVVCDGKRAKIVFTRNENSLDFMHDGVPFTHKPKSVIRACLDFVLLEEWILFGF